MERRKVTFKLYPNAREAERLTAWVRLHCELYNGALQERIEAYRKYGKAISYYDQQNVLPEIKRDRPEFVELGSHALQQTLHRLDLAFQAFFRRVKARQAPGFPRFKASSRFSGFCYPDPAGWKILQCGKRGGTLRLGSGKEAMSIRLRGKPLRHILSFILISSIRLEPSVIGKSVPGVVNRILNRLHPSCGRRSIVVTSATTRAFGRLICWRIISAVLPVTSAVTLPSFVSIAFMRRSR